MNIDDMVDMAVTSGEVTAGVNMALISARAGKTICAPLLRRSAAPSENCWSESEMQYLRENCGLVSYTDIAMTLGRSYNAVKIRARRMGLKSPGRHPAQVSLDKFARMIGIDDHAIAGIIERGEITAALNLTPLGYVRFVRVEDVFTWLRRIESHIMVRLDKADPRVREFVKQVQAEAHDRYISTAEAARLYDALHGCSVGTKNIYRAVVKLNKIPYIQVRNTSGRHKSARWVKTYVLESDVKKLQIKILGPRRKSQ